MVFEISAFASTFIAGFGRAFSGWFINSYADKQIQAIEWQKLGETALIFGVVALAAGIGQNLGAEYMAVIGVFAGFVVQEAWKKFTKKKSSKRR